MLPTLRSTSIYIFVLKTKGKKCNFVIFSNDSTNMILICFPTGDLDPSEVF